MRAALLALALLASLLMAPPAAADGARYVSFTIGRGLASNAVNCQPAPGSVDTLEVAAYAASKGIPMVANVVPAYVEEGAKRASGRACKGFRNHLYLSLADLRLMRDRYGSEHSTSGLLYRALSTLGYSEKRREVCGAFDWMDAHGFTRSRGMFAGANPGGYPMSAADVDVVRSCGGVWARDYGEVTWPYGPKIDGRRIPTNVRANLHPGRYVRSVSLNGGSCPAWADCGSGAKRVYTDVDRTIANLRQAPDGSYTVLQAYQWREGNGPTHECRPGYDRWTAHAEDMCWIDYKRILDSLPADYIATDPLTVARAWGVS